jgi:pyruvyltransferase
MKLTIAALLDRFRGAGSGDDSDIVKRACLENAAEPPATKAPPIALAYPIGVKDIGDRLGPIAVQHATGRPTIWTRPTPDEHLLGHGSILHWATPLSHVWGTGLDPAEAVGELDGERIWALRGKLTYDLLKPEIAGLRDVPLGDPLYLLGRRVAAIAPARATAHRLGILPRIADRDHPAIAHLRTQDGVAVLNLRDPPPVFFAQMLACEAVASTSLSALILAEALGVPNLWLDFGVGNPERAFEFQDWFSLAGKPQAAPLRPGNEPRAGDLIAVAALHEMKIDERALRSALPRAVLDELSLPPRKAARIVHTLSCRRRPLPIFLPCRDLGARLQQMAAAYRRQSAPTELVLIDGGGAGAETQQAIAALQQDGALVRVIDPGTPQQQAVSLRHVIQQYFKRWGEPQRYAIASGAVDFSTASPHAFTLYDELLDCFPEVEAVGPMVRIEDLPFGHPALSAEIAQHWLQERSSCETSFGTVGVVQASLLDNFALCRADGRHRAPSSGLRVHHPFDARNLGWAESATQKERLARRLYW